MLTCVLIYSMSSVENPVNISMEITRKLGNTLHFSRSLTDVFFLRKCALLVPIPDDNYDNLNNIIVT
jgi:hypothetical protein